MSCSGILSSRCSSPTPSIAADSLGLAYDNNSFIFRLQSGNSQASSEKVRFYGTDPYGSQRMSLFKVDVSRWLKSLSAASLEADHVLIGGFGTAHGGSRRPAQARFLDQRVQRGNHDQCQYR